MRIAHWSLAALVFLDLADDSGGKLHRWAGYAAAGVVGLRLVYAAVERSGPARVHLPRRVRAGAICGKCCRAALRASPVTIRWAPT